jgi:hypothetical protein
VKKDSPPIRRRMFLKAGIGASFLVAFPFKKLLSFSVFSSCRHHELDKCRPKQLGERIRSISLKYGSEFGEIKPEPRRNDHGCV